MEWYSGGPKIKIPLVKTLDNGVWIDKIDFNPIVLLHKRIKAIPSEAPKGILMNLECNFYQLFNVLAEIYDTCPFNIEIHIKDIEHDIFRLNKENHDQTLRQNGIMQNSILYIEILLNKQPELNSEEILMNNESMIEDNETKEIDKILNDTPFKTARYYHEANNYNNESISQDDILLGIFHINRNSESYTKSRKFNEKAQE